MRGLSGKVVVVAGGGGIGAATVQRLVEGGARVVVGDINATHATELAESLRAAGHACIGTGFDITDEASVNALVALAVQVRATWCLGIAALKHLLW
jgi:NAD(P)-dependent dehydrogenase (short-subunit alcohol dehydrogenase family)